MRQKYMALMLAVLVLLVACTGTMGSVAPDGHDREGSLPAGSSVRHPGTDLNAHPCMLPADNTPQALFVTVENPGFAAPYVSRARSLAYQNDNRNIILKYVREHPGSMLFDMARSLDMNIGTLRYHLTILEAGHLVVAHNDGLRQVRYFINNGTYTEEQMTVISMLKREPTSKLLGALAGSGGMTCAGIALGSGLCYSEVNRYLKELMARGIVMRESPDGKKYRYTIVPGLEGYVIGNLLP